MHSLGLPPLFMVIVFLTMKAKCNCAQIESQCPHLLGVLRHAKINAKINQLKQCFDVAGYNLFIL